MKLKYAGTLLTCLGLVTAVTAVPAQQYTRPRETAKAAPVEDGDVAPPPRAKSADADYQRTQPLDRSGNMQTRPAMERPDLVDDNDPFVGGKLPPGIAPEAVLLNVNGEQNKLAQSEAALARQAEELKHLLERNRGDARRSEFRTKLSKNLGEQFDLRQKRHAMEIEALETQVKKLKELVRKRQESREDIISRRLDQIEREADGLGW